MKYCTHLPLARIGAQMPAWLAAMTDKNKVCFLQDQSELINF
jgi:hypothetical protein